MEVALRGASVAEDGEHDTWIALQLQAPGEADRLRQLARDRSLEGEHLEVLRDLECDRVAYMPEEGEPKGVAMPQLACQLAVLRDKPVGGGVDRHRRANGCGFLADAGGEGDHPALSLEAHRTLVESPASEHAAIAFERHLVTHRLLDEKLAVLVEVTHHRRHRDRGNAVEVSVSGGCRLFHARCSVRPACRSRVR